LDDNQEVLINKALSAYPQDEVLVNAFDINITRRDLQTLKGLNWLNDEVINFYMSLLCERSNSENSNLKTYAFTTFFYPKLIKDGYTSLRRWTRKVDIFAHDLILVPIHLGMHWTLACVDFTCKEIRYYDSMNGNNNECLKALR
jgi:sentrin-specific protease 1